MIFYSNEIDDEKQEIDGDERETVEGITIKRFIVMTWSPWLVNDALRYHRLMKVVYVSWVSGIPQAGSAQRPDKVCITQWEVGR